jgi:tRNA-intron endonuclease, archaea type
VSGILQPDATVRFDDPAEASSVYAKGFFGSLGPGGALTLDRYEAVYLSEMERVAVRGGNGRPVRWSAIFRRAVRHDRGFPVRYLVYRDLRQRGYVVRTSPPPVAFSVLPRGGTLHKTPSRYWVEALSERVPFDLARLFDLADRAQSAKKVLLLGLVDEESDLTYYRVRRPSPTGALPPRRLAEPT